ncbi:TonB-dependent siderophore receptor [Azospirillum doebereinerae]|uniref:TonB-dependent siderophore receptor n=1 Tax=Azospirillum doebereinerae TaxID=92933 RepID=A0A433J431_9PROT|nr:TonB-dependent siderophore receptor [Azospirillum doebereinerae]RUQ66739.1 TonB-dependent siderophore receptor [Azospirillum doebereinerae]
MLAEVSGRRGRAVARPDRPLPRHKRSGGDRPDRPRQRRRLAPWPSGVRPRPLERRRGVAQPLSFANKAGIQLFYDAAPLGALRSNGVSGTFSVSEGLARLLAGSGLTYRFTGANSVALATAQGAASGPVVIDPVQVGGAATGFNIQTPPDSGYQAKRILSTTKTETDLRDVPQAVTRQQMDDQAIQNLEGAVRYVPGVGFAQGEGNRDTAVFRGNSTTADFFLDGIRDDVEYYGDLYNIERVEVVKGPNAMIFGRGGVGGLINRVSRQADWTRTREAKVETGSNAHYRGSFDVGQGVDEAVALRLTGVYEVSESYRNGVELRRWGLNPTASFRLDENTLLQVGYEHFQDDRVADRGIPSFRGQPFETGTATFFGDPERSPVKARVDAVTAAVEHRFDNGISLRNRTGYRLNLYGSVQTAEPGRVPAVPSSRLSPSTILAGRRA